MTRRRPPRPEWKSRDHEGLVRHRRDVHQDEPAAHVAQRGLPGGSSLARLLEAERGVRNRKALPRLVLEQVRAWAVAWPNRASGPIPEAPGETWSALVAALSKGARGLPAGWSMARLRKGGA